MTRGGHFAFDQAALTRLRMELHTLVGNIRECFQSQRRMSSVEDDVDSVGSFQSAASDPSTEAETKSTSDKTFSTGDLSQQAEFAASSSDETSEEEKEEEEEAKGGMSDDEDCNEDSSLNAPSSPVTVDDKEVEQDRTVNHTAGQSIWSRPRSGNGSSLITQSLRAKTAKRRQSALNRPRSVKTYLKWTRVDLRYKRSKNFTTYKEKQMKYFKAAKRTINRYYKTSLEYGHLDRFYKIAMHTATSRKEYIKRSRTLRKELARKKKTASRLKINIPLKFMDNNKSGEEGTKQGTARQFLVREKILQFEYRMNDLHVWTCAACRENLLVFNGDKTQKAVKDQKKGKWVCPRCVEKRRNKKEFADYHLENNLHPIWYERSDDGSEFKRDEQGNKIIRYDIPEPLAALNTAERLAIRLCAPVVPAFHIKNGVMGLKGHCVCYPQDITEMVTELPHKKDVIVTFLRNISSRKTGVAYSTHLNVNRVKVLNALRFLKQHHADGYRHVVINEDNFDWMEGKEEASLVTEDAYHTNIQKSKRQHALDGEEYVSKNQCAQDGLEDDGEIEFSTVHPNYNMTPPNKRQRQNVETLHATAVETNQQDKMMQFPPINYEAPIW
eukprot:scaffold5962_cov80-Skeletonema_dohrnii-CCMP3373.AAC.3